MDSALEKLDINASARDIEDYLERFEIWCTAKVNVKEDTKPALFLNFIGKDAYALIKNLTFPDSPISMPYDKIRNALLQHVRPMNFEAAERAKFNTLMRSENQSVRDFVLVLQTQAVKCNYGEQLQMQLRDRLIAGINIPELKQKLLLMVDPTFQNVRQVCEQYEDVLHATSTENTVLFNSSKNSNKKEVSHSKQIQKIH